MKIFLLAFGIFLLANCQAKAITCAGPFGQSPFGATTEQGSSSSATPNGQLTFLGDTLTFGGDNLTFNP